MEAHSREREAMCCLCSSSLHDAKGKGRHKKYNGQSCTRVREFLADFIQTTEIQQSVLPILEVQFATLVYPKLINGVSLPRKSPVSLKI